MAHTVRAALIVTAALAAALPAAAAPGGEAAPGRVTARFSDPSRPGLVKVALLAGSISVEAHAGSDVVIEARQRPLSLPGRPPSAGAAAVETEVGVIEEGNVMRIDAQVARAVVDLRILVPAATALMLRCIEGGDIRVRGVEGEMELSNVRGAIDVQGAAGPVVANNTNGRIAIAFERVPGNAPMAFSTLHGDIEVAFPRDLSADVRLRSGGMISSELPVTLASRRGVQEMRAGQHYRLQSKGEVRGTIGGGGPELRFTTFDGDIVLRVAGR